jgi:hypothetical protein
MKAFFSIVSSVKLTANEADDRRSIPGKVQEFISSLYVRQEKGDTK